MKENSTHRGSLILPALGGFACIPAKGLFTLGEFTVFSNMSFLVVRQGGDLPEGPHLWCMHTASLPCGISHDY